MNAYEENYRISQSDDFVILMNHALSMNERFFRIHALGDFYSIEYFNKWVTIARSNPHITFMAYTRNHEVFELPRPDNLRLLYSTDRPTPTSFRMATVVESSLKKLEHLTPVSFDGVEYRVCTSADCIHCLACWLENFNIAFPQKYPVHDDSKT
jgi:hypothetical protein